VDHVCNYNRLSFVLYCVVTVLACGSFVTQVKGQSPPQISATYRGLTPTTPANDGLPAMFRYRWVERDKWVERVAGVVPGIPNNEPSVGILNWDVPSSEFTTAGLDRTFRTYCAEAPIGVTSGKTYRFQVQSPSLPEAFGLPETPDGRAEAVRRASYIRELYGRYYLTSLDDPNATRSFQVALWEIIHETQLPPAKAAPFDLTTGNFQADYANLAAAPSFVRQAQDYLKSLTGNENLFYDNPGLAGMELIRLKGLAGAGAGDIAAQSQFALQSVQASASNNAVATAGSGVTSGLGGSGSGGPGGGSPSLGGVPTGFGPGAGFGGVGSPGTTGGSSTTGTSTGAGSTTEPTTTSSTPFQPPTTSSNDPPINQPPNNSVLPAIDQLPPTPPQTSPVPAPAGVVLGLVAWGIVAGRRSLGRVARSK
jgi:hypothetical protein